MKRLSTIMIVLAVFCFMSLASSMLYAQEWSPAQKEVWKVVEEIALLWSKGDIEGLYKHNHPDNSFWSYSNPVPISFESSKKFDALGAKQFKVQAYSQTPLTILVYDSFAVVNHILLAYLMGEDGKQSKMNWRATWVFKKEGTKWLLVANHGGDYSQLK